MPKKFLVGEMVWVSTHGILKALGVRIEGVRCVVMHSNLGMYVIYLNFQFKSFGFIE